MRFLILLMTGAVLAAPALAQPHDHNKAAPEHAGHNMPEMPDMAHDHAAPRANKK